MKRGPPRAVDSPPVCLITGGQRVIHPTTRRPPAAPPPPALPQPAIGGGDLHLHQTPPLHSTLQSHCPPPPQLFTTAFKLLIEALTEQFPGLGGRRLAPEAGVGSWQLIKRGAGTPWKIQAGYLVAGYGYNTSSAHWLRCPVDKKMLLQTLVRLVAPSH